MSEISRLRTDGIFSQRKMNIVQKGGENRMKVKKKTLLLIASFVWIVAGFNIVWIGVLAYSAYISILNLFLSAVVFAVFQLFIFRRLVKKHTERITGYEEEYQFFWNFFDLKSFVLMAIMMTGGIALRVSGLGPERFIAVFYSGLGMALLLAGILFGWNYLRLFRCQETE